MIWLSIYLSFIVKHWYRDQAFQKIDDVLSICSIFLSHHLYVIFFLSTSPIFNIFDKILLTYIDFFLYILFPLFYTYHFITLYLVCGLIVLYRDLINLYLWLISLISLQDLVKYTWLLLVWNFIKYLSYFKKF